ncbi:hypothetical protein ACLB2K_031192 [Fragaria x ananassa]
MILLNDDFSFAASEYQENVVYDNVLDTSLNVSHVDYNSDYDKYNMLVREVQTPLYLDSEHTVLGTVIEQMRIKNKRGKTNVKTHPELHPEPKVSFAGTTSKENLPKIRYNLI